jgi:hypothetical protein
MHVKHLQSCATQSGEDQDGWETGPWFGQGVYRMKRDCLVWEMMVKRGLARDFVSVKEKNVWPINSLLP